MQQVVQEKDQQVNAELARLHDCQAQIRTLEQKLQERDEALREMRESEVGVKSEPMARTILRPTIDSSFVRALVFHPLGCGFEPHCGRLLPWFEDWLGHAGRQLNFQFNR